MAKNLSRATAQNSDYYQRELYDQLVLASSVINQLSNLFDIICRNPDNHFSIEVLADIGRYLADDWGNSFDVDAEKLKEEVGL